MHQKERNEFYQLKQKLGKNIQKARKAAGLTQEDMADDPYPIQLRAYQYIEAGQQNVTIDRLAQLSRKLGCPMRDFFKGI